MTLFKPETNTLIGTQDIPYIGVCQFGEHRIRVFGTNNNPMFPLRDVCNATGQRTSDAKDSLKLEFGEGVRESRIPLQTAGGMQDHILINEDEFYHLAGTGRTEFSKAFRAFVREVMKQIRLVGSYNLAPPKTSAELILEAITLLTQQVAEEKRLKEEAIRTKALIGSKREATAMATASAKSREAKILSERVEGLEVKVEDLEVKLDEHKSYMSLKLFVSTYKLKAELANGTNGKKLTNICNARKLEVRQVADANYGTVKSYPVSVLKEFFNIK